MRALTTRQRNVRGADTTRTLLLAAAGRDDKLSIHDHDTAHISLTPGITHLPSHGDCSELLEHFRHGNHCMLHIAPWQIKRMKAKNINYRIHDTCSNHCIKRMDDG